MKGIFIFLFAAVTHVCFSQEIDIKKDVVYVDDNPVFKINGGAFSQNMSIENMDGKKLIYIKLDRENKNANGNSPGILTFAGFPNLTATYQFTIPLKKSLAKEVIENDLIEDGQLNEENVYRYCNATMPNINRTNVNININSDGSGQKRYYTPVDRNTDADVFVSSNTIKQDFKEIGKYKISSTTVQGKDGTPIAEVKYLMASEEAELFLFSKEKTSTIDIPNANDFDVVKDVVKYLIDLRQL